MEREWAIVGGGMLGLTLALRFAQAGKKVTLYEAAPELGGLASAWTLGDVVWDRHYHVTLLSDAHTRAIVRELGLEDEMTWVETRTGFYADGRLSSLSNSLDYLLLPALPMTSKLRLAATIVHGSRISDWKRLERVPVEDWLVKLSGRTTFDKLWLPLLRAKLGESYRETSAAFIWATIARLYAARRTGLKKEMFGYVRGGYARLLAAFETKLRALGVTLELGRGAERVMPSGDPELPVEVRPRGGEPRAFERVFVTVPAPAASKICVGLTPDEAARLSGIRYQGIVCASLLLSKPLADYYLTYLTDDWVPFTAVVEMTAMVDRAHFGGKSLVYLPRYAPADHEVFGLSDDDVRERFLSALERIYPHMRRESVLSFRVSRVKNVFPIPTLHYSERLPPKRTSVRGLSLVSSANIVNGTLNVNETVALAERTAREVLEGA